MESYPDSEKGGLSDASAFRYAERRHSESEGTMRVGFVRKAGLGAVLIAAAALGACNDDPISWDANDTADIFVNPTVMVVPAGRESKLASRAVNPGNEPTFAEVSWAIDPTAGCVDSGVNVGSVTVTEDPDRLPIQPPGLFVVTGGTTIGQTCILLTSGSLDPETVKVTVVGDDVALVCPSTVRGGDTGTLTAALVSSDGEPVGPFDQNSDILWETDDSTVVNVDQSGNWVATTSGAAEITATWSGTAETGTDGVSITRVGSCVITVGGGEPASAAFADADSLGSLGAYEVGEEIELQVLVFDAEGNLTNNPDEITGVTVTSSDPAVATATAAVSDPGDGTAQVIVSVEALSGGQTTLSGTVQTTEGPLAFEGILSVVAPAITSIAPDPVAPGEPITITGVSLGFDGLATEVTFNGFPATDVTVVSGTELTVIPPLMGDAGTVEVVVSVSGVLSEVATYTETGTWDSDDTEPENGEWPATVNVGFPLNFTGSVGGADVDDWFVVTVPENGTMSIDLDWDDAGNDIDIYINDTSAAPGLTIPPIVCFDGGTLGKPEATVCDVTAGTYVIWITDFGPGVSNYTVSGTF
jgi:hypothetical protein